MEHFIVGRRTYVSSRTGDRITGDLIEIDTIGVTLDRAYPETNERRVTELSYCYNPMASIELISQEI